MSLILQGKILQVSLKDHAKNLDVLASPTLISTTKLLWLALANFYNDKTHQCNPSIKTLAKYIEKSESQTTVHMNKLKELGLVGINKNPKGGRFTPNYTIHIPGNHPVDRSASPPEDHTPPQLAPDSTPLTHAIVPTYEQDASPITHRTRILIEPLDEILIKDLVLEKDPSIKNVKLVEIAQKYKFPFQSNTPINSLETWLLQAIHQSTVHRINHGTH
jgi:hypothetical protein